MPSSDPFKGEPWVRHGPGCFCHNCQGRQRRQAREALRQPRVIVPTDQTAQHIASLLAAGWTRSAIAHSAGVSGALITKASRAGNGLNESSAEAILAVR